MTTAKNQRNKGIILIFALWLLAFLAVLASSLGVFVRQKIALLKRVEQSGKLHFLAGACVQKALITLNANIEKMNEKSTATQKMLCHNNRHDFENIILGDGSCEVSYALRETSKFTKIYGLIDEESKININAADSATLSGLFERAVGLSAKEAQDLARAIIDWRETGEGEMQGFSSDNFYQNLEYAYPLKNNRFDVIDELLLVKGMTPSIYEKISDLVTVYGEGHVNVNTASETVLSALGLSAEAVKGILLARRGADGVEATEDDHVMTNVVTIPAEASLRAKISEADEEAIYQLTAKGRLDVYSDYYTVKSFAYLTGNDSPYRILCVFDGKEKKIVYWREN